LTIRDSTRTHTHTHARTHTRRPRASCVCLYVSTSWCSPTDGRRGRVHVRSRRGVGGGMSTSHHSKHHSVILHAVLVVELARSRSRPTSSSPHFRTSATETTTRTMATTTTTMRAVRREQNMSTSSFYDARATDVHGDTRANGRERVNERTNARSKRMMDGARDTI